MKVEEAIQAMKELVDGYHRRLPSPSIRVHETGTRTWMTLSCGPVSVTLGSAEAPSRPHDDPKFKATLESVNQQLHYLYNTFEVTT